MTLENAVLKTALEFYSSGISVIPAKVDGSKAPLGAWKNYQDNLPTLEEIVGWFGKGHQGIGVVTGAISGNLEMLELEGRAVADKLHIRARDIAHDTGLGQLWDRLNNGYCERTPSGGLHWLYRISDGPVPGNTKLARKPGENGSVDVLAETRGEGGFVITAPSAGNTHPSGGEWSMLLGSVSSIPDFTTEERNSLHSIFMSLDQMPTRETTISAITKDSTSTKPGDDYNARANWKQLLEPLGWKAIYTQGTTTYWRRPNKTDGFSATTGRNEGDNLYVFSTSTSFEAEKPYSLFAAYTHIHHNGDYSAAAKTLAKEGYGSTVTSSVSPLRLLSAYTNPQGQVDGYSPSTTFEGGDMTSSSWKPIELQPYFDGTHTAIIPTLFSREDGNHLIYPGKVHSFYGESESGKSWLAQICVAQELKAFHKVIYIDFESDAPDIIERLQLLGVSQAEILQNFTYIHPDTAHNILDPHWQELLTPQRASLVIIDGVTEALNMSGKETKDNDGITEWMRKFPRALAAGSGAAVITIDHVTKDKETRGRFAIGGQAKLATIDGAAYLVEPLEVMAPGKVGTLTVRVTKDRPGYIRKIAGMYRKSDRTQEAAVITVDSSGAGITYLIAVARSEEQMLEEKYDDIDHRIADFLYTNPGCSKKRIKDGVVGGNDAILMRIEEMRKMGFIMNTGTDRASMLALTDKGVGEFNLSGGTVLEFTGKK